MIDGLFPIESWNHFDNEDDRTNNRVEGYNNKLDKYLNSHPNIWKFIIKIKSEETNASLTYSRINNDTYKSRRRNNKDILRDLQITKLKLKYVSNEISITEYIAQLATTVIHDYLL